MSIARKIAHKAEAVKGAFKKTVGRLTGSRRLRAEGRADQAAFPIAGPGAVRLDPGASRSPMYQPIEDVSGVSDARHGYRVLPDARSVLECWCRVR